MITSPLTNWLLSSSLPPIDANSGYTVAGSGEDRSRVELNRGADADKGVDRWGAACGGWCGCRQVILNQVPPEKALFERPICSARTYGWQRW